jgi:hypothetical protein
MHTTNERIVSWEGDSAPVPVPVPATVATLEDEYTDADSFETFCQIREDELDGAGTHELVHHILGCGGSKRATTYCNRASLRSNVCLMHRPAAYAFVLCFEGADYTDAYFNAPPPTEPTYVRIDDNYADWFRFRGKERKLTARWCFQGLNLHPVTMERKLTARW